MPLRPRFTGSSNTPEAFLAAPHNLLIELLPSKDRVRLLENCERVDLVLADVLCEPGEPTRYVYFPVEGFISLVALA